MVREKWSTRWGLRLAATMALAGAAACVGCPGPAEPEPGETRTFDGIQFQWCPAGTFTMGSPEEEVGRAEDETQHEVTLTQGFWLGRYEVTQAQWESVIGDNPAEFNIDTRNPVESVSWDDVQDFIAALNADSPGMTFRLPTESEWEYACRAGTQTIFYWGDDGAPAAVDDYMWYWGNSGLEPRPVGGKLPNAWGLRDMSGNVWEWCSDRYGPYPAGPVTDPLGPAAGMNHVVRGGAWINFPAFCRSATRAEAAPDTRENTVGFRLALTP